VRVYIAAPLVRTAPTGFFILVGLVTIDIVVIACGNGSREGVLSQAGLNKTTERYPRQRRSQRKSNFRTHARDEKQLFPAVASLFITFSQCPPSAVRPVVNLVARFPQIPLNVGRLPRLILAT
jgi:hypothetical protein